MKLLRKDCKLDMMFTSTFQRIKSRLGHSPTAVRFMCACLCFLVLTGCARKITSTTPVIYASVTLYLRDAVDINNYNYYIILRHETALGSENPIKAGPSEPGEYYPSPGLSFDEDNAYIESHKSPTDETGIGHYYDTYFDSWTDYFVVGNGVDNSNMRVFKSESTTFSSSTTQNATYDILYDIGATYATKTSSESGQTEHTLTVTFPTDRLSNTPSLIYIAAVSSLKSEADPTETGYFQDKFLESSTYLDLSSAGLLLNKISGNPFYDIPGPSDILAIEAYTY